MRRFVETCFLLFELSSPAGGWPVWEWRVTDKRAVETCGLLGKIQLAHRKAEANVIVDSEMWKTQLNAWFPHSNIINDITDTICLQLHC
jgi:hypothetical protein